MASTTGGTRPEWVSGAIYPFDSRFFDTPDGHRMHYVDEGEGSPIVFVHGNPSWSFEFRGVITGLRDEFRCIAADHIGFGLSSRSDSPEDHHPTAHAERFAALLEHLDVHDATLFLTDWGGPIGLDFARRHPDRVARLVVANTWCWPVSDDRHFRMFSFMMRSPVGQFLIKRFNFFVTQVMPRAVADKAVLTPEVMRHYRNAQPRGERAACAALPGHIIGASDWLASIWADREAFADTPALALWGLRDIAFRRQELDQWEATLTDLEVHAFEDVGHFVAEEAPDRVVPLLREFMRRA
ncbi:MAG: alpha/beta fold hydrolase [Chloroflexota bacterium]|nr:alpha/beta fold hydrolase [Chloroflexota bacterium]